MRVAALLRGVNLGKRQVKMADLRAAVESLGHTDVGTYLQSGNVVFTPAGSTDGSDGADQALGIEIAVVAPHRQGARPVIDDRTRTRSMIRRRWW